MEYNYEVASPAEERPGRYHPGQCIGGYQLHHLLGEGGFTEVYLGKHIETGQLAALKLLEAQQSGNELEKFFARASVLSHLHHRHIVEVYTSGIEDGIAYLAMSYASRGNMRQRYPKGTCLPLEMVREYVRQAVSGLEYVHQHHLIHRDLKPHNMLLSADNLLMLSDFGIAVVTPSIDPSNLAFHDFEGTVIYAAPEQLQGRPRRSSDQYSLAVVIFEWLSGHWPFNGTFDEIVQQHLFTPPPTLQELGVSVHPAVQEVLSTALSKTPEERYSTITDFAQHFEQACNESETAALQQLLTSKRKQFRSPFHLL